MKDGSREHTLSLNKLPAPHVGGSGQGDYGSESSLHKNLHSLPPVRDNQPRERLKLMLRAYQRGMNWAGKIGFVCTRTCPWVGTRGGKDSDTATVLLLVRSRRMKRFVLDLTFQQGVPPEGTAATKRSSVRADHRAIEQHAWERSSYYCDPWLGACGEGSVLHVRYRKKKMESLYRLE